MAEQPVGHDDDAKIKPRTRRVENGCRSDCLGCVFVILILAFLVLVVPVLVKEVHVIGEIQKWRDFGIDSYSITLAVSGPASIACLGPYESVRLKVIDNEIVDIHGERFDTDNPERYRSCTIDGLFEQAKNCIVFCNVKYDSVYGFPNQFSVGFIEGGVLSVVDFQPLDSDVEN